MFKFKDIKKILVIRYRFAGDTVLSIPVIKNLGVNFPSAQIDVLVSPNSGELIESNPYVKNVIYFDNSNFHKYEKSQRKANTCYSFFECVSLLRKNKYDLVLLLKRSFSSAVLAFMSGAKYRIGFNTELRSFLLTHPVKYENTLHEIDNFLNCLITIGIKPKKYMPEIFLEDNEKIKANGFLVRLERFKPKILIHATSAHPYKQWPKRYFSKLIDYLYEEFDAQFVFTGAKIDKPVYEKIISMCRSKNKLKILNLCGLTTLRECYAVYQGVDLAVCVDSGNAHLAAACDIPTYVLYGPTKPERWLPIGKYVFPIRLNQLLACQPCDVKVDCSHLSCMKLLTSEFVFSNLGGLSKK